MTPQGCREIREMLAGFLDDEQSCDVSHGIQEHLDRCPPCAGLARAEQAFTASLKTRLRRIDAPSDLASKMRARLREEAGAPPLAPARAVILRRAGYAVAASVLLVLLLAPLAETLSPGLLRRAVATLWGEHSEQRIAGVLVCVECEKAGVSLDQQRFCHEESHHTGVRVDAKGVWNLVVNDASLPVLSDPGNRGSQVVLEGRFLDDIRYIDARRITLESRPRAGCGGPRAPCTARMTGPIMTSWAATSSSSTTPTSRP